MDAYANRGASETHSDFPMSPPTAGSPAQYCLANPFRLTSLSRFMGNSGVLTGGVVGAIIAASVMFVFVMGPMWDSGGGGPTEPAPFVTNGHGGDLQKLSEAAGGAKALDSSRDLTLVEIFEKTEPGVVRINVQRSSDVVVNDGGVGSGFVYDKRGHVMTNSHVVQAAESIYVTFLDGRSYVASVVGVDKFTDIAILRVDVDPDLLKPLVFGDSSGLKVGEPIAAIGNPFGLSGSMTAGIVSQVGRLLPSGAGYSIPDVIQTDAAINPGNSGGPLLNMRGEVIGINNAIQSTTGEFAGVGFAISSQTLVKVAPTLITDGSYAHPWIGISGRDVGPETARLMDLEETVGFLIVDIIGGSPADEAGLVPSMHAAIIRGEELRIGGDVILGVDGQDVRKIDDILIHLQRSKSVGDTLELDILRDGQMMKVELTLQQRPD